MTCADRAGKLTAKLLKLGLGLHSRKFACGTMAQRLMEVGRARAHEAALRLPRMLQLVCAAAQPRCSWAVHHYKSCDGGRELSSVAIMGRCSLQLVCMQYIERDAIALICFSVTSNVRPEPL